MFCTRLFSFVFWIDLYPSLLQSLFYDKRLTIVKQEEEEGDKEEEEEEEEEAEEEQEQEIKKMDSEKVK